MPRPNLTAKNAGISSTQKSSNPLRNWLENRKERIQNAQEEASRLITNKIAENENVIIDKLNSIDFIKSALPQSVLEAKSRPEQPYGDLEYAAQGIAQMLRKNPQTIKTDIRKFDEKLLALVILFKQSVEYGSVRAAYAAKGAIVRAVVDIRNRIPQEQPELTTLFVEANTKYLEQWILLVMLAQVADALKKNVGEQRARLENAQNKNKESVDELFQRINSDPQYLAAFHSLNQRTGNEDRSKWNETEREIHRLMVERRMEEVNLQINNVVLQQQEMSLMEKENQVELLYTKVASLPIVTDPNLMNQYNESIDELFKQMAESDAMIDETLKSMDDMEGRIQQLNRAPGSLRAQEVAAEQSQKVLDEINANQKLQTGISAARAKKMMEELGILTQEELAEKQRQAEMEQQRQLAEIQQQVFVQDQEMLMN